MSSTLTRDIVTPKTDLNSLPCATATREGKMAKQNKRMLSRLLLCFQFHSSTSIPTLPPTIEQFICLRCQEPIKQLWNYLYIYSNLQRKPKHLHEKLEFKIFQKSLNEKLRDCHFMGSYVSLKLTMKTTV